ncbi:hypothetical protein Cgig2_024531 [Carnegiea gigantea]|uniref:Aminotransferase-like plant mobile domain-containing protein n=1 Tax=Carnegiea gigantea TaxID=171969 RepID=A0A9Q1JXS4_9CARY|nr:hypothetical protein Cgig2_024531 [Carnegiea gigantea]
MPSGNHGRSFHSRKSFLIRLSIGNGWRIDLLVANDLFDSLYASLFVYDKHPNIVRVICEYWCFETNSLHTLKGEVFISLLDIQGFLGLPLSVYHILRQRLDHKSTIEEWVAFWFRGLVKYHAPMKSDRRSRVPLPTHVPLITKVHGWSESHAVFDKLGVPKGEYAETLPAAFLLCWLCLFVLPVRDATCIHLETFSEVSSMKRDQAYCLSFAILASIYRGFGEICRSAHPARKGGHTSLHFLAWVAKYFQTYDFDDNTKIFDLDGAHELISSGRGFVGILLSGVKSKILSSAMANCHGLTLLILLTFVKLFLTKCLAPHLKGFITLTTSSTGEATPLKNKVERLIHQACNLKDLQESYSDRMTTEVRESRCIEVGNKLNEASHQFNTESIRYNALKAKLGHVDSRRKELLKELQSLDDQKKDLSCQAVASEDLLQEAAQAVIDLKGQIDTLNGIEVIGPTNKDSLEKTEAYINESFEDMKTFQWTP